MEQQQNGCFSEQGRGANRTNLVSSQFKLPGSPQEQASAAPSADLSLPGHTERPTGPRFLSLPSRPLATVKGTVRRNEQQSAGVGQGTIESLPTQQMPPVRVPHIASNTLWGGQPNPALGSQGKLPVFSAPGPAKHLPAAQRAPESKKEPPSARGGARAARRWRYRRRVPELRQMSAVECGACCLAMILCYYGRATGVSEVQEHCSVGRDGLSALSIMKAARHYGLRVRAVSLKKNDFRFLSSPAIVHWEFNHFVVLQRWSPRHVDLLDPALGRRRLSPEEFEAGFTGVFLLLEPGAQFSRQKLTRTLSLRTYLGSLPRLRWIIAQIIATSLLLQLIGLGAPLITAIIVDSILPARASNLLTLLGMGVLFLILMQAVMKLLRTSLLIYLQTRVDAQMMLHFFEHLLSLPYRFFQTRLNGDLLARMESNSAIRDLLTSQMISTLLDGTSVLVYLLVLLARSPLVAGVTIAIGAVQVGLLLATAPAIRRLTMRDLIAQGKTQGYLSEVLAGIATIKAAGAEQRALAHWTGLFFAETNISIHRSYLTAAVGIILELLQFLSPLLLLWIGAGLVMRGGMSLGAMLALNTLAVSFLVPLNSLAASGQKIQVARAHFDRLADVLGSEAEQDLGQVQMPPRLRGGIELRDVCFQYAADAVPVLRDISLRIKPGQKVALVGKTGSGKSTLGKLLIGLMTPTHGEILFDDIALRSLNYQEVRRQFGVVLQEAFIFSGSVRSNIALNDPAMDMARIVKAAQAAAIHEDIERMPMGYETQLAEGGSVFSGGQRQRLALARALAHRPALLLLDEATSALDVATEQAVERNLHRFSCTQIVIAHRLSTIRNADLILVLDQGRIVEQGTHQQLLRQCGFYARLIKTQLENGEIHAA
ncbi:MAG TPA: peptidase domain-containing ABC transporter [Ktedonobacteraceae bacterium]